MGACTDTNKKEYTRTRQNRGENMNEVEEQLWKEQFQVGEQSFACSGGFSATDICISENCSSASALICDSSSCSVCRNGHKGCSQVKLKTVTGQLKEQIERQRKLVFQIFEVENSHIQKMYAHRKVLIEQSRDRIVGKKNESIVERLYSRQNGSSIRSAEARQLVQSIRANDGIAKDSLKMTQFDREFERSTVALSKMQEDILGRPIVQKGQGTFKEVSVNGLASSKIINARQSDEINFIIESLNRPKTVELIFRASEHGFLAANFHRYCDNVAHTLCLIRTEFGKTIGGYTPLAWNCVAHGNYAKDTAQSSFLLSLDLREKMVLLQPENAIFCRADCGPIFGGGCDIWITDRCDGNNLSNANFPYSYNCGRKYQNSQSSYTAFSGATKGYNFRVVEYEVYRIVW